MTFKDNWEKTHSHTFVEEYLIKGMVAQFQPASSLTSYGVISGGCANLNIKIWITGYDIPLILRIYTRDPAAAYREKYISELVYPHVPAPQLLYIGEQGGYRFAIVQFLNGITLRDLILRHPDEDSRSVVYEAGLMLTRLQKFHFDKVGFFHDSSDIIRPFSMEDYQSFVRDCLSHPTVYEVLGPDYIPRITNIMDRYGFLHDHGSHGHLVHADYDPSNILVHQRDNQWKISGILDWEFAFSGPWLLDVSTMLRYAHQLPPHFTESFIHGLRDGGGELPPHWPSIIGLYNIIALLDILIRSLYQERPIQTADIYALLTHIIHHLEKDECLYL